MFREHDEKDRFFDKVRNVNQMLGSFPLEQLKGLAGGGDRQVFNLQQRALGEALAVPDGSDLRCMRFAEFMDRWLDPNFKNRFEPLTRFLDRLEKPDRHRWRRLELMKDALEQLRLKCRELLKTPTM
jgi:hypothetical protein